MCQNFFQTQIIFLFLPQLNHSVCQIQCGKYYGNDRKEFLCHQSQGWEFVVHSKHIHKSESTNMYGMTDYHFYWVIILQSWILVFAQWRSEYFNHMSLFINVKLANLHDIIIKYVSTFLPVNKLILLYPKLKPVSFCFVFLFCFVLFLFVCLFFCLQNSFHFQCKHCNYIYHPPTQCFHVHQVSLYVSFTYFITIQFKYINLFQIIFSFILNE